MFVTCCIYTVQLWHVGVSQHSQFQVRFDWPDHLLSFGVLVRILKFCLCSKGFPALWTDRHIKNTLARLKIEMLLK